MERSVLASGSVTDSVDARYSYTFKLRRGDDSGQFSVSAAVLCDGRDVGRAEGSLIDRRRAGFFDTCDSLSQELCDIAADFCASDIGKLKRDIAGTSPAERASASAGGFVHINLVTLDVEHRGADVGLRCLHELLTWLLQARPWTIAVLFPAPDPGALPHDEASQGTAISKIRCQWMRLGFVRRNSNSSFFYLFPDRLTIRSKTEVPASDVAEVAPALAPASLEWALTMDTFLPLRHELHAMLFQQWQLGSLPGTHVAYDSTHMPAQRKANWFEMMIDSKFLPNIIHQLRKQDFGHKRLNEVDFSVFSTQSTAAWLTPLAAYVMMVTAEALERSWWDSEFCSEYGYALRGEAKAAFRAQGVAGLQHMKDPNRERTWFLAVSDCFTWIAQQLAQGTAPHPRTHAELWALCLIFDVRTCRQI